VKIWKNGTNHSKRADKMLKVTEMNNNEMEFELERMEEGGTVTQEMFVWTVA
jgi:hypothetical protein